MSLPLHLIDAFSNGAFTGNPAAVVLLDGRRPDRWMQRVAMEMNQAETAFVEREDTTFLLRWFTPASEVDLCGHATLASAHFLWETGVLDPVSPAQFDTRSGRLKATRLDDGAITLDFPAIPSRATAPPDNLEAVLGVVPREVLRGSYDLLCILGDSAAVRALAPDLAAIAAWDVRGVIVTAPGDQPGIDFVSRCFFPALGVPEDPVTGSAHCALAPYWHGVTGRADLTGYQASARGGMVRCGIRGDRVELTGRAVTTLEGALLA